MNATEMEAALRDSAEFLKAQLALGFTDRDAEVKSLCAQIHELRSLDKAGAGRISRALADMDWQTPEQVMLATAVRACALAAENASIVHFSRQHRK